MATLLQANFATGETLSAQPLPLPDPPHGVRVSPVFDTFWRFAAQRQEIFFARLSSPDRYPWTDDLVLRQNKFTNAYRASDRVSQYLIRNVILSGPNSADETFFRIILFKLFNRIETWQLLTATVGSPTWKEYSFYHYDAILSKAIESDRRIYSAAYIMPSGGKCERKHRHHLRLLERMMADNLPERLQRCVTMESAFLQVRSFPSIGDFLAYQFVTDLNYSELLNFSEMEFVCPGPGARDGIRKCFTNTGNCSTEALIRWMTETQEAQFERLSLKFRNLWGRPLQLIDCQNLFCEVDKYARYIHPEIIGISGRSRIKQRFRPNLLPIEYAYPEKWEIGDNLRRFAANWGKQAHFSAIAAD
jgi:hypothetical protein